MRLLFKQEERFNGDGMDATAWARANGEKQFGATVRIKALDTFAQADQVTKYGLRMLAKSRF